MEAVPPVNKASNPLVGPPPAEVPLSAPPLVRVIAQARFPLIASIEMQGFVAPFQEAIRAAYPVLRPERTRITVPGAEGTRDATMWRFHDPATDWCVTLAPDFVALETGRYSSREDFMDRLRTALQALEAHVNPRVIDRLGVRYIDRVEGSNMSDLPELVRPEVAGMLRSAFAEHIHHALSEQMFILPEGGGVVTARWGLLPARTTVDAAALEPIEQPSWLLDFDAYQVFHGSPRTFDVDGVVQQARGFAERIYSLFRWAVTDEFLRRYGGPQ
jgi:uncharacterized protein (TIGR04255 family)